jgi:hypothetical protein
MGAAYVYGAWAGVLLVGSGYWYLSNKGKKASSKAGKRIESREEKRTIQPRKDSKKSKKPRGGATASGSDQANDGAERKRVKSVDSGLGEKETTAAVLVDDGGDDGEDDEIDNREFARQLSNAKAGTVMAARPEAASRQKSVKQSRALASTPISQAPESADGDDDLSSANSPPLAASRGDVSDMLEAPSAGPSVLRLTEPTNPKPQKSKPASRSPEPAETKKQRQNRKKAEAKKVAREEEEKERRVLMEKQLRSARIAEGRAAKDGSNFMASKAPASSAWIAPAATPAANKESTQPQVDLLDTYEPTSNGTSGTWQKDLPSEEEQLRRINEEDDSAWNTVSNPKKKKRTSVQDAPASQAANVENTKPASRPAPGGAKKLNARSSSGFSTLSELDPDMYGHEDDDSDDEAARGSGPPPRIGPTGRMEHAIWQSGKGWVFFEENEWAV